MNKRCIPLAEDDYYALIKAIREGYTTEDGHKVRGNRRVALVAVVEGCCGIRCGDIMKLKLDNIIKHGDSYYFNITEEKTGKRREFPFDKDLYLMLQQYAIDKGIRNNELLFPIRERQVAKTIEKAVKYLGLQGPIGTHSLRKMFANSIYNATGNNLAIVQKVLQHSSLLVTERYLNVTSEEVKQALSTTNKFVI